MNQAAVRPVHFKESLSRSVAKTATYRIFIMALDFLTLYLFTGKVKIALGFVLVSNTYTTVGYFLHERAWDRVKWGKTKAVSRDDGLAADGAVPEEVK